MAWTFEHDDDGHLVTLDSARFGVDNAMALFETMRNDGIGPSTPFVVFDLRPTASFEIELESLHRIAVGTQVVLRFTPATRVALVAGTPASNVFVDEYVPVRNNVTARPAERQAELGVFSDLDSARAWAKAARAR
ncbi:MAG: hypothetical protein AAF081_16315 [Actinomycetota bacterium]